MSFLIKKALFFWKELVVVLFYFLLTILLTWPIAPNLSTSLHAQGDPELVSWIIYHGQKHIINFDFDFFNTNTFYPFRNNLAFTDHSIAIALTTLPFRIFTSDPIVIFNIAALLSYFLSAVGAFFLARYYTNNILASVIAGVIFAFCPFHVSQIGHLQIITYQWIPFAILYFEKFLKSNKTNDLIWFSIFFLLQALSTIYHFTFLTLALIIIFILRIWLKEFKFTRRNFIQLACAGIAILLVMLPFLIPYIRFSRQYNIERSLGDSLPYSADLMDFLTIPLGWFWGDILLGKLNLPNARAAVEHSLFPGGIAILSFIGLLFIYFFFKKKKIAGINNMLVYIILTVSTAILAMGPILQIGGKKTWLGGFAIAMPYAFLYYVFYPLRAIRVPERIGVIFMLGMAMATAIVLSIVYKNIKNSLVRKALLVIIGLVVIVEYIAVPFPVQQFEGPYIQKNLWIRDNTPENAIILELREAIESIRSGYLEVEAKPMLASAVHERRIINGYSGYFPPEWFHLRQDLNQNFDAEMLSVLKAMGNVYIVFDKQFDFPIKDSTLLLLDEKYRDDRYSIYTIKDLVLKAKTTQPPTPVVQLFNDYVKIQWPNFSDSVYYTGESFTTLALTSENEIKKIIVNNPMYHKSKSILTRSIPTDKPYTGSMILFNNDTIASSDIVAEPNITIKSLVSKVRVNSNQNFTVDLLIKNNSKYKLSSYGRYPVLVGFGYKMKGQDDQEIQFIFRSPLPKVLLYKQSAITPVFCTAPSQPGHYVLKLTLVQEDVKWFTDVNKEFAVDVEVEVI